MKTIKGVLVGVAGFVCNFIVMIVYILVKLFMATVMKLAEGIIEFIVAMWACPRKSYEWRREIIYKRNYKKAEKFYDEYQMGRMSFDECHEKLRELGF